MVNSVLRRAGVVLGAAVAAVTVVSPPAVAGDDIADALRRVPGLTVVSEQPGPEGHRFFTLTFTQPADHTRPGAGTFQQRLTLLHRDVSAPTVSYTSGYNVSTAPSRSEPTQLVGGNQLSMEYRYFAPSRPEQVNWPRQLTIWQAATDQHRVVRAFKSIYRGAWLATGGSKGGMTATYFRRFYPDDVAGTIAYVAPNDVWNNVDRYNRFLDGVGDPACREKLHAVRRAALQRRDELGVLLAEEARAKGYTFEIMGSADRALETAVVDSYFTFWQYSTSADCGIVPPPDAPATELYAYFDKVESLATFADQQLEQYVPYYYQAATQIGWAEPYEHGLRGLLRYPGSMAAPSFVPRSVPVPRYDHLAMPDVDLWVRTRGERLMFVNGENDPWTVEPFRLGFGSRDSYVYEVPGGNHGSKIAQLPAAEAAAATATVRRWAGLPATAEPAAPLVAGFDEDPLRARRLHP
ncbi:S28 family serine protease [Amycolatopsis suaedae]|uniref:Aminopeptidase n=1 Tax=Amycolatopsis suaedae TaxID=2510978 RepID=A0A4Q7J5Y6_9PSEU|nr:S28 family serine protease [Amycolatopsis suaedae]RZQ63001.1 aminopeptidase [Amycolatopsis suaedae]